MGVGQDAADLLHFSRERFVARVAGLDDAEAAWQPAGEGVPTIAWRLDHLAHAVWPVPTSKTTGAEFAAGWFDHAARPPFPTGAADAVAELSRRWAGVADRVAAFTDDELFAPLGAVAGPFAEANLLGLVLHIADELIHHAAEVALLRDLYAHRS
jgi:hypothetical protein